MRNKGREFFAKLNIFSMMAHYTAKILHIRPNEILDEWCVPELIVAFGQFANDEANRHYQDWKGLDAKTRASTKKPNEYAVYFHFDEE